LIDKVCEWCVDSGYTIICSVWIICGILWYKVVDMSTYYNYCIAFCARTFVSMCACPMHLFNQCLDIWHRLFVDFNISIIRQLDFQWQFFHTEWFIVAVIYDLFKTNIIILHNFNFGFIVVMYVCVFVMYALHCIIQSNTFI
jgi:hypothetical protein